MNSINTKKTFLASCRLLKLMLVVCLFLLQSQISRCQWSYTASMPGAKEMHGTTALDGYIYVLGGSGPSNICYRYEIATNTWSSIANLPTAVSYPSASAYNGKVYVTGGYAGCCGGTETSALQIYDPATNTWSLGAPMPFTRSSHGSAFVGGKLYVVGGSIAATVYNTLFEYDPVLNTWTTRAPMAVARYMVTAASANGKLYATCGYSGGVLATHEEYTPGTNTWVTRAATPVARYLQGGGSVMDGGVEKVFVCGGNGGGWLNTCRLYDPLTNTWSAIPNMLAVRGRTSGTGINNCIYMPGGTNGASAQATSETTCLTAVLVQNLLYFDVYKEQSIVKLTWAFPGEATPASADVQRSLDGIEFETIGKSEAVAAPDIPYLFSDAEVKDIARETVHYRLQIWNQDGSFSFSEILSVDMRNAGFTATGHPNPVQDQFTCEIMSYGDHSVKFRITDILGRELMANAFMTVDGHNAYNLDLSELSRGTYFMFLSAPSGHQILQFVKE